MRLIVVPEVPEGLAQAVGRMHLNCTQYVNRLRGRCGGPRQGRFFSCALDEEHFRRALVYVERKAVRGRVVRRPRRHPWSSAAAHCGAAKQAAGRDAAGLLDLARWREGLCPSGDGSQRLSRPEDAAAVARLRRHDCTI